MADEGSNLGTVATVAKVLSEVERVLVLLTEKEIERAMVLLMGYLQESLEQHGVDLPF